MRDAALPAAVALSAVLIEAAPARIGDWLAYDRGGLAAGELWRAITGHLAHLGWAHLWLNLAGLALVWVLVGEQLSGGRGAGATLTVAALMSGLMWVFSPSIASYVGLSGLLHGLLVAGVVPMLRSRPAFASVLIVAVAGKVAWEQYAGPSPGTEALVGGAVLVDAHLYGAIAGLVVGPMLLLSRRAP